MRIKSEQKPSCQRVVEYIANLVLGEFLLEIGVHHEQIIELILCYLFLLILLF